MKHHISRICQRIPVIRIIYRIGQISKHEGLKGLISRSRIIIRKIYRYVIPRSCRTYQLAKILRAHSDRKGIIIYPPIGDWNRMKQRPHHLMLEFARHGYLGFYCSPQTHGDVVYGFKKVDDRLFLCEDIEYLRGIRNPILLIGWTEHLCVVEKFIKPIVIYDYLDDLSLSAVGGNIDAYKLDQHKKLLASSQIVCATAGRLYKDATATREDVLYCPNGVEYKHFRFPLDIVPGDLKPVLSKNRPIIGYYGALAKWFDYELLEYASKKCPSFQFVLIGCNYDGSLYESNILQRPNVIYLGEKKYEALPIYLKNFSVATVPFRINSITLATSPIKIFEYMAGGKPIVSTDLPECRKYQSVLIGSTYEAYVEQLKRAIALQENADYLRILDEEALANTWQARFAQIQDALNRIQQGSNIKKAA